MLGSTLKPNFKDNRINCEITYKDVGLLKWVKKLYKL